MWISIAILAIVILASLALAKYFDTSAPTTADRVFSEVSQQFGFTREQVLYFTIYGSDRVQYNAGEGLTFAFKENGSWHISGPVGAQEVPLCSLLATVPEKYRQACYDDTIKRNLHIDSEDGQNANYPTREGVRYIRTQN